MAEFQRAAGAVAAGLVIATARAGAARADDCRATAYQRDGADGAFPVEIVAEEALNAAGDGQPREGATVHCQLVVGGQRLGDVQVRTTDFGGKAICDAGLGRGAEVAYMRWTVLAGDGCANKSGRLRLHLDR